MRRADRLFQIVQILRRGAGPVTAAAIAAELEVSPRTVYRDIADLIGQRVPISGEAGFGYVLDAGFDMPPLMLTAEEIEAVALGAQWVAAHADAALARAAEDVLAKIAAVLPAPLQMILAEPSVGIRPKNGMADDPWAAPIRQAIRAGRKLQLRYRNGEGMETERTLWPVLLGYAEGLRMLVAWCELRGDFRHFRSDRICDLALLDARTGLRPAELRRRWLRWREERGGDRQEAR